MWRHHPQARRLRELLPRIGELRLIRGAFSFGLSDDTNIRLSRELEGGALMDVGCYCVSAARLLAGEPESCTGRQVLGGDGVDVRFAGTMLFPGDVLAHFDCGMDMTSRDELEAAGSEGTLFMDDPWHSRAPVIELRAADGSVEAIEVDAADPYGCQLEDFAAACSGSRPHPFGRDDAVGQARAIAALYESAAR
jgi:predicted dehydrogenase